MSNVLVIGSGAGALRHIGLFHSPVAAIVQHCQEAGAKPEPAPKDRDWFRLSAADTSANTTAYYFEPTLEPPKKPRPFYRTLPKFNRRPKGRQR